ncbi:conserved hypothetical protein [Paenibacillus curdlanolyticus YK9]|uniref:Anti-sigma-W factor RsiW n=1 Tax=Paenibacillus curdlanolyticus YK9 TaxID=717606 RepID=E0I356_9BACL|nr:zf-HC2 domain-containing protein [Paenibacillus curdlanolyticus]EFM12720.1 conserved hypothetical protein [Paenibacillus curdlanolyticus YK9]
MTCQEVMDFMQRQLDGDLNENEAEILTAHTRHCSDCADMFDRLKRLSTELESLPKVVPAFSIVDSIMPQLDQIEIASAEPKQPEAEGDTEVSQPASRRAPRRREGGWFKRVSWPAVSGVVAAGIVAGLFLVMYNPIQPNMESKSDTASTESTAASDVAPKTAVDETLTISQDDVQKTTNDTEVRTESPSSFGGSGDATGDRPLVGAPKVSESEQRIGTAGTSGQNKIEKVTPYADDPADQDEYTPSYKEIAPLAPADESTSDSKSVSAIVKNQYGQAMSIMSDGAASTSAVSNVTNSPDGLYSAAIMEGAIYIYTIQEGTVMYEGVKHAGETSNVSWSDDSKVLFFEVKDADGQTTHYKVDTATWSASKV